MQHKKLILISMCFLLTLFCSQVLFAATTGKISGRVIDKETGEPLPGANVVIEGTAMGAATDPDGYYTILQLPPGLYEVSASVIGYSKTRISNVRVRIDQTTSIDFTLAMEALEGETITVTAELPVVKPDVSTSVAAMSTDEVLALPSSDIGAAVRIQAGVTGDYQIRGGSMDQALSLIDGATMRDPRNNNPIAAVALSAVQEISIARGGFQAEYGQVQSGIVNIVTKEGDKSKYQGSLIVKYSSPSPKNFGMSPYDPNGFWFRPYLDDAVCWTGTENGGWDKYTQRQYLKFDGWNKISRITLEDSDPTNDLTPAGAQQVFLYEMRRKPVTDQPDYNIDAGFGGPVPFVSSMLGDLRFFGSYRQYREMLLVPLTRDDYVENAGTLRLISNISPSKKLNISVLSGKTYTTAQNWVQSAYIRTPEDVAGQMGDRSNNMFSDGTFSLTDISHLTISAKFTHTLSNNTYYETSLEHIQTKYFTRPPAERDRTLIAEAVPGYWMSEAPFGYSYLIENGVAGMFFGGHVCKQRDNSLATATTFKADLTSQINFANQVKAGVELVYNDLDLDYGLMASGKKDEYSSRVQMHFFPVRVAFYAQNKLETKGFIANLGLRLDYSNAQATWYAGDIYDPSFFSNKYTSSTTYPTKKSRGQYQFSPRLGISHPITENSKLFFNYGHFKQMPSYEQLFQISRQSNNQMVQFGDPNLTLAKTISYELGYDHSLFENYLIQLAGFYNDVSDQTTTTQFYGQGSLVYSQINNNGYADNRGIEITFRKNVGRWWTAMANYTYLVTTSGQFGSKRTYLDPSLQKQWDDFPTNFYPNRPIPQPFARAYLQLFTPKDFGPEMSGIHPVDNMRLNVVSNWQAGGWRLWNPKNTTIIDVNVQQKDYFNMTARFGKLFKFKKGELELFVEVSNVLNTKRLSLIFPTNDDYIDYMNSLHLPASTAYDNIPGDDKVGEYREDDVAYQPVIGRGYIDYTIDVGENGVIYYDKSTSKYMNCIDGAWSEVDRAKMDKILKDKAYIDMPNQTFFNFLNPRDYFFGIRTSFDLN